MKKNGLLIACEGIDGSGKSLLAKNLFDALQSRNTPVLLTKEPGATDLGKQLRTILHATDVQKSPLAEFFLFAADRAQHFSQVVLPALNIGSIVISDRMADSSLAYQGYGRGLDYTMIQQTNTWAMSHIKPDLTLYLRIAPYIAHQRIAKRNEALTSFEQEQEQFWKKVCHGFETIFANRSDVVILDATKSPQELTTIALSAVLNLIQNPRI